MLILASLVSFCASGCREIVIGYPDRLDIRRLTITPGVAFDIRVISDTYGKPQHIDLNSSSLIYSNDYSTYDTFFWHTMPLSAETWYLLLSPTDSPDFYVGERYFYRESARQQSSGTALLLETDVCTSRAQILKRCKRADSDAVKAQDHSSH